MPARQRSSHHFLAGGSARDWVDAGNHAECVFLVNRPARSMCRCLVGVSLGYRVVKSLRFEAARRYTTNPFLSLTPSGKFEYG